MATRWIIETPKLLTWWFLFLFYNNKINNKYNKSICLYGFNPVDSIVMRTNKQTKKGSQMKKEIRYKFIIATKYIEGGTFHTDFEELEDAKATFDDLKARDDYEYFSIVKCVNYQDDEISEDLFERDVFNAIIKEVA